MSTLEDRELELYRQKIITQLSKHGLNISFEDNFNSFRNTCSDLPGKSDPVNLFYDQAKLKDAFWIKGTDHRGKTVLTQAYCRLSNGDLCLGEALGEDPSNFMSKGQGIDPDATIFDLSPAFTVSGEDGVYHGEVWLAEEYRGNSLALLISRLGFVEAIRRWDPDYIFAFMYSRLVYRGIASQYGYTHITPNGAKWWVPERQEYNSEWLAWINRDELKLLLTICPCAEHEQALSMHSGSTNSIAA